jgi:sec-independent protein translocase protein TatA
MPMGGVELLVLLVIILLFFGAKRVPQLAKSLGVGARELKKAASEGADESETKEASAKEASESKTKVVRRWSQRTPRPREVRTERSGMHRTNSGTVFRKR